MFKQLGKRMLRAAPLVILVITVSSRGIAASYALSDGNSRIEITVADPLLVQEWTVDGVTISGESGLWYGYNHPGAPNNITSVQQTASNRLELNWYFLGLGAGATYQLEGGDSGSGEATLKETLWLLNAFPGASPFKAFDYNHYNLSNGPTLGDEASMLEPGTLLQTGSAASLAVSSDLRPAHYEIGEPLGLLSHVGNVPDVGTPMDLNDSPPLGVSFSIQTGSPAFAFQWNPSLGPFETQTISTVSKHLTVNRSGPVPEPGSLFLVVTGGMSMAGFALWGKRRR